VVFPLFVLQPSLGFGIASSKAPHPMRARLKSLMTHTVFGLGLFACAWGLRYVLGSSSPQTWTEPKTGIELARIPAGTFVMGSPLDEAGREEQELLHEVEISQAFYLGTTEVTQRQWQRVMGSNPSHFTTCGLDCPVERVNWNQVQTFMAQLGRLAGYRFRLPTEAEWEYACRSGTSTPFGTGSSLSTDQANFDGEGPYRGSAPGLFRRSTTTVRTFAPSSFGLFDMHGNVWEWTQDWHCPYPRGHVRDPLGACRTDFKVIRGGSWYFDANSARCALRYTHRPQDSGFSLGFRVAASTDDLRAAA